ncbi:MAG TPA: exosortase N [Pedobacter sp.]
MWYIVLACVVLHNYYLWNANVLIGVCLAPYICSVDVGKFSMRYLVPSVALTVLAVFIPVKTTIFVALLFCLLLFLENYLGKIRPMLLLLLLIISPIFNYISNAIGFPIRLWLSDASASLLSLTGVDTHAYGNLIMQGGNEFAVDQACAGLNMMATSLIICLFVIAYYQKRTFKKFPALYVVSLLILTTVLNVVCNLIRIVLLVQFKIAAESIYHDFIGLLCLLVYVILPLLFLVKEFIGKFGRKYKAGTASQSYVDMPRYIWLHIILLGIVSIVACNLKNMGQIAPSITNISFPGYKKEILDNGILKFENNDALIYLKSGTYYAPEHDPMVCWKGSGYNFKSIKKETIGSTEIYTGILEKGNDKIYSAWWFDNGKIKTISQFLWRWKAARGQGNFYLVNANAKDASTLRRITTEVLSENHNQQR